MFALVMLECEPGFVSLKCDPDLALELRARYAAVEPGHHANKRPWNDVHPDRSIEDVVGRRSMQCNLRAVPSLSIDSRRRPTESAFPRPRINADPARADWPSLTGRSSVLCAHPYSRWVGSEIRGGRR
jgi:hypothetical protein